MEVILEGRKVSKWYQMGEVRVEALKDVDFHFYQGELVVVLGPSGSGKSTLLNMVGGMDRISAGELYHRSQSLHEADDQALTRYRRETVGFIFQFYNLIPNLTALENVQLAAEITREPLPAQEVLAEMGLAGLAGHFPSQMSGGEQQRVAVARAMVKNPSILLCDEPTGALDSEIGILVLKALRNFNRARGKTVVIITHNTGIAAMAHRVFHMRDGNVARVERIAAPIAPEEVNW